MQVKCSAKPVLVPVTQIQLTSFTECISTHIAFYSALPPTPAIIVHPAEDLWCKQLLQCQISPEDRLQVKRLLELN